MLDALEFWVLGGVLGIWSFMVFGFSGLGQSLLLHVEVQNLLQAFAPGLFCKVVGAKP